MPGQQLNSTLLSSSSVDHRSNLDLLAERLRSLEEKIVGRSNEVKLQQNVIKNLATINARLAATLGNKEKISSVNGQIESYEKYINDPSLIDRFADDSLVKAEIVLDNEQRIRKQYAMLEKIALKEKLIESKFINDFDTFLPKLQKIRWVCPMNTVLFNFLSCGSQMTFIWVYLCVQICVHLGSFLFIFCFFLPTTQRDGSKATGAKQTNSGGNQKAT